MLTSDGEDSPLAEAHELDGDADALGVAPPKPEAHESVTLPSAPDDPGAPPAFVLHVGVMARRLKDGATYDEPPPPGRPL